MDLSSKKMQGFDAPMSLVPSFPPAFDIQNGMGPVISYVPSGPPPPKIDESLSEQMRRSLSLNESKKELGRDPAYMRTMASHFTPSQSAPPAVDHRCSCQRWY